MRYVIVLSLFVVGCATQSSAGGGKPSQVARPGSPGIYEDPGPRAQPEDMSRFVNPSPQYDIQVRDFEHPEASRGRRD